MDNLTAFRDTIAYSEIGPELLAVSDNGYNVLVGSTAADPLLFTSYATHPRIFNYVLHSDAAGRYQFLGRYWPTYCAQLHLPDFGPASQDRWCNQLIKECHAIDDIALGHIDTALRKCATRWASLPGAGYGQHENTLTALLDAYHALGGSFTADPSADAKGLA